MAKKAARPTFIQASRRVPAEQKAVFHQVSGAGRARVKRPFLGLTPQEEDEIGKRVEAAVDRRIEKGSS